jgi:hypothetical protein
MIFEILLALFLVLVLRLLDGWVERRRDVLHYVTKPSRGARDNAGRPARESEEKTNSPTVPEQSSQ